MAQVYIPDEETVFIQEAEPSDENDESLKDTCATAEPKDRKVISPREEESTDITNDAQANSKYRYTYPKTLKKSIYNMTDNIANSSAIISNKKISYSFSPSRKTSKPPYDSSPHVSAYDEHYAHSSTFKYDRIPSHLPQVMSTRSSPVNNIEHSNISRDNRLYPQKYERYNMDYQRSKYYSFHETDTSSTWASQYRTDHRPTMSYSKNIEFSKYETYGPYDKYRSMATLQPEDRALLEEPPSFVTRTSEAKKENSNKEDEAGSPDETQTGKECSENPSDPANSADDPPELVRITAPDETRKLEYDLKSPPALEKCDVVIYDGNLKEEEDSRDSINDDSMETTSENKQLIEQKTEPTEDITVANKFL